ncbi:hypothetical protein R3P38DRAFT_3213632 [Favolaschia claudopus]|uniref:Uncharacterized protein n=1 Tax=Favolaschia claudopus TaxID=2862362 RepID=A0AAW0AD99_9AGAR
MNVPYHLERFLDDGKQLWARSVNCTGSRGILQPECASCLSVKLGQTLINLEFRAQSAPAHTPYQYLTHNQLTDALREVTAQKNTQRLTILNMARKVSRTTARMSDHKRLLMAMSTCDIPRLNMLIRVGIKQRAGPNELIKRIAGAVSTLNPTGYRTRSYTDTDKKFMRCMKHLAGRKGVYALSKALGLPSMSTIRASKPLRLLPSVSAPKPAEIGTNISTFFGPESPNSKFSSAGHVLMIDGLHLSQRACWHRGSNQILGLCREHSEPFDLSMNNMPSVLKVVDAVHGDTPKCHYGREATVLAVAAFRDHNYHGIPIAQTQTCKSEKGPGFAALLRTAIDQWEKHGEPQNGPLFIVSTDGDSVFREGAFQVLMCRTVDESSPLYLKLSGCMGLNLQCGKKNVVLGPDTKHVAKRIATNERSPEGTVIDQVVLNRPIITQWLEKLPGETKETVAILVDPADHQNVPKAYKLLRAIISVGKDGIPDTPSLSPTDKITHRAFALAGEMWRAFLDAFTVRELSLSERLASLSQFARMAFVFYRMHGSSFLSNQLYGDLQALVKAAFFCVARQQELDPEQVFYLYQIGSDRLEELFSEVRTESHDSNCDSLQLSERLSTAADTLAIFAEHPEWHQGHVRRSWSGKEADHVNPTYFTGDQRVKTVVLTTVWQAGRSAADEFLRNHGIDFDFVDILSDPNVDFLRPNGGGIYPGVSTEKDRSLPDDVPNPSSSTEPTSASDSLPDADTMDEEDGDNGAPEDLPNITLEDLLPEPEANSLDASESAGFSSVQPESNQDWLEYQLDSGGAKQLHKASILSTLFNSDYRHLAVNRLLRVRCYTKDGGRKPNLNNVEFSGEHSFNVGDIAVGLIRTGDIVAAAVIKVTVITREKQRVSQIDTEELGCPESKVSITAQLLVLRDVLVVGDGETIPSSHKWLWNGTYAKFDPIKGAHSAVEAGTRKALTVQIPGAFVHPLDAEIEEIKHLPYEERESLRSKHVPHVWAVRQEDLLAVVSAMYDCLEGSSVIKTLPKHGKSAQFPYADAKKIMTFVIAAPTQILAEKTVNSEKIQCYQCHLFIKPDDSWAHVGSHVFKSIKGITDPNLHEPVDSANPCGFCGRAGCQVDLSGLPTSRATPKVTSSCVRAHPFSYGHRKKYSAATPCTNVPIFCTLCTVIPPRKSPPAFWKYSMYPHIRVAHPQHWDELWNRPTNLPADLALNLAISREEMKALGAVHGLSDAPLAQMLQPSARRGQKRPLDDITNTESLAEASPSSRLRM